MTVLAVTPSSPHQQCCRSISLCAVTHLALCSSARSKAHQALRLYSTMPSSKRSTSDKYRYRIKAFQFWIHRSTRTKPKGTRRTLRTPVLKPVASLCLLCFYCDFGGTKSIVSKDCNKTLEMPLWEYPRSKTKMEIIWHSASTL
jgi:hypothetical protein